jgi:hypothetical protein
MGFQRNSVNSKAISGVSAVNPLVAIYDIHGRRGEMLIFLCFGHHTRHFLYNYVILENQTMKC